MYDKSLTLRPPLAGDGADMWHLVRESRVLDLNSSYSYLMLCKFFSETCIVARKADQLVGCVTAFRPPQSRDAIFVWQVVVAESQRGSGLGTKLLRALLERQACRDVRYLETTITPSNKPSQSLFRKLARDLQADCEVTECFPDELFPDEGHEAELMYRIGPFTV